MQAIYAKTKQDINEFLEFIGADLEIVRFNISENEDFTSQQKTEYINEINKLRSHVYEVAKKFT